MSLIPGVLTGAAPGLFFDRKEGHQFRALTSPGGGYYWKPNLMAVIRRCPELARFLPHADFTDSATRVIFTSYSGNNRSEELLSKTLGLNDKGVNIPRSSFEELQAALAKFKSMSGDPSLTPDEARFVSEFKLPDRIQFPGAYRVLRTNWYSSNRLFVLWGLEPAGSRTTPVIKLVARPGAASSQVAADEVTPAEEQDAGQDSPPPPVDSGSNERVPPAVPPGKTNQSDGSRWRGCLWPLLLLLLLLLAILLLSECVPTSCEERPLVPKEGTPQPPRPGNPSPEPEAPLPEPVPKRPQPLPPQPLPDKPFPRPPEPFEQPPPWWKAPAPVPGAKIVPDRIIPIPDKAPKSPGVFEVYIREGTSLIQKPPAAEIHLGLRFHGTGRIKDVTWILEDGAKHDGVSLDELVPFNKALSASTEIDVTFTYVDEAGQEHQGDGFSFRYELQGRITFEEGITDSLDKRSPEQKDLERKKESEKKAIDKGA